MVGYWSSPKNQNCFPCRPRFRLVKANCQSQQELLSCWVPCQNQEGGTKCGTIVETPQPATLLGSPTTNELKRPGMSHEALQEFTKCKSWSVMCSHLLKTTQPHSSL